MHDKLVGGALALSIGVCAAGPGAAVATAPTGGKKPLAHGATDAYTFAPRT